MTSADDSVRDGNAPHVPNEQSWPRPRQTKLPPAEKNASRFLSGSATVPMPLPRHNGSLRFSPAPFPHGRVVGSSTVPSVTLSPSTASPVSSGLPVPWSLAWRAQPCHPSTPLTSSRAVPSSDLDIGLPAHPTASMPSRAEDCNIQPHAHQVPPYLAVSRSYGKNKSSSVGGTPSVRQEWRTATASPTMSLGACASAQIAFDSRTPSQSTRGSEPRSNFNFEGAEEASSCQTDAGEADALQLPPLWSKGLQELQGLGWDTLLGVCIRNKITNALLTFVKEEPRSPFSPGQNVQIVEYGAVKGRGYPLVQAIIVRLAEAATEESSLMLEEKNGTGVDARISFSVLHCDEPSSDFRGLMLSLANDPESYLAPGWAQRALGVTNNGVYHSLAARPFGACVAPRESVDFGVSLMDLQWSRSPVTAGLAAAADAELSMFLRARATELRPGAQLVVAYLVREPESLLSSSSSTACSTSRPAMNNCDVSKLYPVREPVQDVYSVLNDILAPTLQWLVSCGMLAGDLARHMLALPMHLRTAAESVATLRREADTWSIDWSCGLGQYPSPDGAGPLNEPNPVRVPHPAWVSYNAGVLSRVAYCEQVIALIKHLFAEHWRSTLTARGRLSKGATAFVLDTISDVLQSRLDSPELQLHRIEFQICIYTLRRR